MSETAEKINGLTSNLNTQLRAKEVFDPRIIDDRGSGKSLWSTESVDLAMKGISEGYKLIENPYLKSVKGALLRKAHLPFLYTDDEIEIMSICMKDKLFFANNFGKLKDGDKGWVNIDLRDYQADLLERYKKHRWNIIMFPRQSGKTTTTILEILHFCCFNVDKDCVVIAQSDKVVNEILAKIKEAFAGLPFFMQPGFISFNKNGFVLDNGCRLSIGIASESVVQGFSLDLLYIDEFAYIKPSLVRKFWDNVYPTLINNPNSRCIITSTPNGRNMFWELWSNAELQLNKFIPYRIYWYDVPGRDEQFKSDTIANVGISGWELGFECSFDTQLKSIFHTRTQKYLRELQLKNKELWSKNNNPIGNKFNMEFIKNSNDNDTFILDGVSYNLREDYFLLGIDLAEGLEQDSTVAKLKKIEWSVAEKKLIYRTIGVFKDNTISIEDFAEWIMDFAKNFNINNLRIIVENNNYGGEFFSQIKSLKLIEQQKYAYFDNVMFGKFMRDSKGDYEYGIRWNGQNKKLAVKSFSNLVKEKTLIENHYLSIEEYLNFGKMKNDTYAAQYGHDDLVMADVTISAYIKSNNIYANEFLNNVKNNLRFWLNDEDEEVKKRKEEEKRKEDGIYKLDGFTIRQHENHVKEGNTDIYLLDIMM